MPRKRRRGRPPRPMPERIPDTPENVARALMMTPPIDEWDYLRERQPAAEAASGQPVDGGEPAT